jgi:hypothetical protein
MFLHPSGLPPQSTWLSRPSQNNIVAAKEDEAKAKRMHWDADVIAVGRNGHFST